ncbi:MAG: TlpA disulfide reductase family protein [Candidatus Omnitrophica bacterium]|nr:TlpA disulfide reductase family protein [Candidatus Omnitrophota bacterium]
MKIKNWLGITAVIIICFTQTAFSAEKKLAPDFTLKDLAQKNFTLNDYINKQPVLLFFWTTWCPFCREELKILKEKYAELAKDGLELAAINAGESSLKVERFTKDYNLPFRVLLDKDYAVSNAFDVLGVPTYILIDKKGYIRLVEHSFPKEKYKSIIAE